MMTRNSFQTVADVKLQQVGPGTQVQITLRSEYVVAAFITFWLAIAIVFNIVVLAAGWGHFGDFVLTLFFPVFGFGLLGLGRLIAKGDRTALMEFVIQVTDGRLTE